MAGLRKILGVLAVIILLCPALANCALEPLYIDILKYESGEEVTRSPIKISGYVSDPRATVTINGIETEVVKWSPEHGRFDSDWIQLVEGKNSIHVVATVGVRTVSKTITIIYNPVLYVAFGLSRPTVEDELTETPTTVKGWVSDPRARVTVNGKEVAVAKDGTFSTLLDLVEGENIITVVATLGGQEASETKTAILRVPKPLSLEIKSPQDGAEFNIDFVKIYGSVSDPEDTVMVNGTRAQVAKDGTYYAYIELAEGENTIEAVAIRGEERFSETISVIYNPPPPSTVTDSLSLKIDSPGHGTEHKVNLLKVSGTVSDSEAVVVVNGVEAKVAGDGTYYAYIELTEGENDIEAVAVRDMAKSSETINVTFSPPLAIYLDYPEELEFGVDYSKTPITVHGVVSDPKAMVRVNGVVVDVLPDGRFSTQVQLAVGSNGIEAVATLGEQTDSWTIGIIVSPEGWLQYPPGGAGGPRYLSELFHDDSTTLGPGETKLLDVTLDVKKPHGGPGPREISYTLFRVAREYGEDEIPMPEGLEVSVEPTRFTIYPNAVYHSTITIKTTPELAPGEYWLSFETEFEGSFWMGGGIRVNVVP